MFCVRVLSRVGAVSSERPLTFEFLAYSLFYSCLFPSQRVGAGVQAQVSVEEEDRQHDHQRAGDELGGEGEPVEHV